MHHQGTLLGPVGRLTLLVIMSIALICRSVEDRNGHQPLNLDQNVLYGVLLHP